MRATPAPSQWARWKKVKHRIIDLLHACDWAGHLNVRLLKARLAAGTAKSLRNLLLFGSFLACYDPRLTRVHVYFHQVGCGPKMPLRLQPRWVKHAEACGDLLPSPGDGPAPARRHTANWSRGSRRSLLQEKYISAAFLCISNSCERQIKGAAA